MLLYKEQEIAFHHTVAQLIFVTSRARKYIKMAIAFLCTKVRILNNDDQEKLVRVIRYIKGTLHLPVILRADSLSVIKWWVDASFNAWPVYKGHTGAMMYIGIRSNNGAIMEEKNKWEDTNLK